MVAKISFGKSIRGILIYNEDKVQKGDAELLLASGFATEITNLNLQQKTGRFEKLNRLNPNVKTNTMHISLNFDPSEKLNTQTLQQIAMTYMDQIGFAEQPYVVYSHYDAGHPHLHIATTLMQADGKRKYTHHIGRLISEPARKNIEQVFGLMKAEGRKQQQVLGIRPAVYGEKPTKGQLSSIIKAIVDNYAFSSLAEFNAVLKQFNVRADRGQEDTRMFEKGGLVYTILDELNHPVGVPIKASSFYHQPTLKNLQTKFLEDEQKRKALKADLKRNIDQVFTKYEQFTIATLL
ncbi:MAG: relaxase, partial [Pedobacter sp.]